MEPQKNKRGIDYWIMMVAIMLMLVVVMVQVISRFFLAPITWGEEVAKWLMIWIVFGGLGYASKEGGLISVDFFVKRFKPKNQKKVYIFNMLATILYFAILFISSASYFMLLKNKGQKFPITKMPSTFTVVAMLAGSVLAIIFGIQQIKVIKNMDYIGKEDE